MKQTTVWFSPAYKKAAAKRAKELRRGAAKALLFLERLGGSGGKRPMSMTKTQVANLLLQVADMAIDASEAVRKDDLDNAYACAEEARADLKKAMDAILEEP
jgi:hypothetical protein